MRRQRTAAAAALWLAAALLSGCASLAEFRKLEREVDSLREGGGPQSQRERLAELSSEMSRLDAEVRELRGRVEVAERNLEEVREVARAARREAGARASQAPPGEGPAGGAPEGGPAPGEEGAGPVSAEVQAYREAYASWRGGDVEACVDRFREFLQTYPSSAYADDAAYWMADCYFKQGDYKTAILRFDDVVARYPTGNKAADALYRQGEALLRLGPGYGKAAGKAFERVLDEYPDSARAPEARRQLDLLRSG